MELARRGSLSATARALGVTHVTVSRRISNLEADIGQTLFSRESGRYVLTEAGKRIVELARPMSSSADAIVRVAASLHAKLTGPVRLTCTEAVGVHIVMPALETIRQRYPEVELDLRITQANLNLARSDADIAIRLAKPTDDAGVSCTQVCELRYDLYASRKYIESRQPDDYEFIGYSHEFANWNEAQTLEAVARGYRIAMRINHLGNRIEAARRGLGLALIPAVMADNYPELVRISTGSPVMRREVYALMHEDFQDVPRIKACFDTLIDVIRARGNA